MPSVISRKIRQQKGEQQKQFVESFIVAFLGECV
jgi:hypothetical protein